jgi:hypothetical protein
MPRTLQLLASFQGKYTGMPKLTLLTDFRETYFTVIEQTPSRRYRWAPLSFTG